MKPPERQQNKPFVQVPISPPSALRITTVAERGLPLGLKSGQLEKRRGCSGSLRSDGLSPGCWMLREFFYREAA